MIDFTNTDRKKICDRVISQIVENGVGFCHLDFLDVNGIMKSFAVKAEQMEDILRRGEGFDGSSINGYGRVEESDMVALPDPTTFAIIPWTSTDVKIGRFICDIYNPDGTRYEGDPRYVLQRVMKQATQEGLEMKAAPELEFFFLKKDSANVPQLTDVRGYFDLDVGNIDQEVRHRIGKYAAAFPKCIVEKIHHEVARSQHEIDIRYMNACDIADATMTMKMIVKSVAASYGFIGTFMPKPWHGHNGSGMHVHMSIWNGDRNLFYDENDPDNISDYLRYWIGGLLTHAPDFTAIQNSWPNSYKRLVPGYEAPTLISWGFKNRSMLIRVPNFFKKANAARCEMRSPDPAGNIYFQLATIFAAGLDGIHQKILPPQPFEVNLFRVPKEERFKLGVKELPESFGQALHNFRHSTFMRQVMGEIAYQAFLDSKMQENEFYNTQVSEWELSRYSNL